MSETIYPTLEWKPDWEQTRRSLLAWWERNGMAIYIQARRDAPRMAMEKPQPSGNLERDWIEPSYRLALSEYEMIWHDYYAEAFPYFDTQIGPGSLGIILGSKPNFVEDTVWYNPIIDDPEAYGAVNFQPENNPIWAQHLAVIEAGVQAANGRYLVGMPDLIENLDTLAALRGDQALLVDLIERPDWVMERLAEINQAYFSVFDAIYARIQDTWGGNAFSAFKIWGPGKTAKLQCDISATLSPRMFKRFVVPYLSEQCAWLDYALYHLDGTNCLQHLDALLGIEHLHAIEWTPQAGQPGGGSPEWYDLFRRIKAGGKGVQAVGVQADEVIPLLDAVGPEGVSILLEHPLSQSEAENLLRSLEPYRGA
jgi:hypothetical protein